MRDVPHPDAVSGDAVVPANGVRRPPAAPRLVALRHRACGVSPAAHESGGARGGLRLDLSTALLARIHLAPSPRGLACGAAVSRDVVLLQAVQLDLGAAHPA